MNSNIFQIQEKYLHIVTELEEAEGELTPELIAKLDISAEERDNKLAAYIAVIKQKQADTKLAKDEIKRLTAIGKRNDKTIERLKNVMLVALETFELRGKKGNVSHTVNGHTLFGRDGVAVNETEADLAYDDIMKYQEYLLFNVTNKFNSNQVKLISGLFAEENENYTDVTTKYSIVKDKFKAAMEDAELEPDETIREEKIEFLEKLAKVVTTTSLIIR